MSRVEKVSWKLRASLACAICGWLVVFPLFYVTLAFIDGRSIRIELDQGTVNLALVTALVTAAGWLLCGVPFILLVSQDSRLLKPRLSLFTGAVIGSVASWLLTALFVVTAGYDARSSIAYMLPITWPFAVGVGAITMWLYSRMVATQPRPTVPTN